MIRRPANLYTAYHAHIYFNAASLDQARSLSKRAGEALDIPVGRVHTKPVGPHPHWSCQLIFDSTSFDKVISWLEQHRHGLDILVHGVTGDDLADHTEHAAWLGEASELNLEIFENNKS